MGADESRRVALTIPELSSILDPPLSVDQLRHLVAALGLKPVNTRRTRSRGRPRPAYDAALIMRVHSALVPFLNLDRAD